jgi:dual specificity phosphatase 12
MSFETHAQQIVPDLYLGNRHTIIGKEDFLKNNQIDLVISALTNEEYKDYMIGSLDFDGVLWYRLVIDDEPDEHIEMHFDFVHFVIKKALAENKRVLVHCSAGVSRSVTLIAAHLILEDGISTEDALKYIAASRPNINPIDAFRNKLKELELQIANGRSKRRLRTTG